MKVKLEDIQARLKAHTCEGCGRIVTNDDLGDDFLNNFHHCANCALFCEGCDQDCEFVDSVGLCPECSTETECEECGRTCPGWDYDDGVDEFGRCLDCSLFCEVRRQCVFEIQTLNLAGASDDEEDREPENMSAHN